MSQPPPPPLLRAPPFPKALFPDADSALSFSGEQGHPPEDPQALFALIRSAKVGGCFWGEPGELPAPKIIRRPKPDPGAGLVPTNITDPWSILPDAQKLIAHGDDEWVALARIIGIEVEVLSPGRFGVPGDDGAALDRYAAKALACIWRDPFTGERTSIEAVVEVLALWRDILHANRPIAAACGMAWWKRAEIRRFLWHPAREFRLTRSAKRALRLASKTNGGVAIWPSRVSPDLIRQAAAQNTPLIRVEDGFLRSVGLGVHLVPPSSVVVDRTGIHFDPTAPSDLEILLQTHDFTPRMIARAKDLRRVIVAGGISKYGAGKGAEPLPPRQQGRKLILVPGQVEDDMSVLAGSHDFTSNLELVRRARAAEPEAEIWFRPHPDVDAGHRKGAVPDEAALEYADRIMREHSMAALLEAADGVHVLTSLTGFEALLRGCDVTCHGAPFYAGWGLTQDLAPIPDTGPDRRTRALTLDELVAGVLILYPRYLDPVSGLPCPPEVLTMRMADNAAGNRLKWVLPLRQIQGLIRGQIQRHIR